MTQVYVLEHSVDGLPERMKLIGVFSSEAAAKAAIASLIEKPGFKETPADFHIDRYDVDQMSWSEGFVL